MWWFPLFASARQAAISIWVVSNLSRLGHLGIVRHRRRSSGVNGEETLQTEEMKVDTSYQYLLILGQSHHMCCKVSISLHLLQHWGDVEGYIAASLVGVKYHLWNNFCGDSQWEIQWYTRRGRVRAWCHTVGGESVKDDQKLIDDEDWSEAGVVISLYTN